MNKYITNITAGFCHQWSKSKSIMEYVSNALDAGNEQFDLGDDYITITTPNTRVSSKFLLVGVSDKRGNDNQRGQFGAGSIQAMAALLSQGVTVTIFNAGVVWTPRFEYSEQWDEEVLVIDEIESIPSSDFVVEISGLDAVDVDEVRQRCVVLQDREVLYSTEYGDILDGDEGEVFVGDMFVCQTKGFKYSYNFKIGEVALSQDRNAVDHWSLQTLTAKLIMATEDKELIKEAISAKSLDTEHVTYSWACRIPEEICEDYANDFIETHGTGVVVTDDYQEHQFHEEHNIESVYMDNKAQVKAIKESEAYEESVKHVEEVEKLEPWEEVENTKKTIEELLDSITMDSYHETVGNVLRELEALQEKAEGWRK